MILDELVLHNFGVYRGRHHIALTPPSPQRPVVLFGGLNGGGKTTLLDGIQLALYGKSAHCSNRGSLAYPDYLERAINSRVSKSDGASLELQFRHRSEGNEATFRLVRSWSVSPGGGVKERLDVFRDGEHDSVLADAWSEHVDEFMPAGISNLFLFDGEKIEGLAELESSSRMLSTAIGALLGLDLVDQLNTDLVVLERRKRTSSLGETDRHAVEAAQAEVALHEERISELTSERASAGNELDLAMKAIAKLDARFRKEGGDVFERRVALETERAALIAQVAETEDALRELAADALPLAIADNLLEAVTKQDAREAEASHAKALAQVLEQRDAKLTRDLRKRSPDVAEWIAEYLAKDRQGRCKVSKVDCYLGLNSENRQQLASLASVLGDARKRAKEYAQKLEKLRASIDRIDRKLASVPSSEAIKDLQDERERGRVRIETARGRLAFLESELERVGRTLEHKREALVRLVEKRVRQEFALEDANRIVRHAQRVRTTLGVFREQLVQRHVQRIERLIIDSFHKLVRKESLISGLTIDPRTFAVTLRDVDGRTLPPERLSAGERQLLAISMLWGLARASGRPLPAVIDTPLGRLDSAHRCHLVRRYFPFASHQVLLLSTDKEIDEHYFEELRPHVGRSYLLDFDNQTATTSVREGYFW